MTQIQGIFHALAWLLTQLKPLLDYVLKGTGATISAFVWLFLSGIMLAVSGFIRGLDFSAVIFQWTAAYANLPPQAIYIMSAVGFPQMVTLIASAYVVRLTLNLIPSWLTRA